MNLHLLHRRPAPVVHGNVTIPATPTVVYAEMLARYTTVHRVDPDATTTGCHLALWPFWEYHVAAIRHLDPVFCDRCWPGHRCVICAMPSGDADECARCLADSLNIDAAIEVAA